MSRIPAARRAWHPGRLLAAKPPANFIRNLLPGFFVLCLALGCCAQAPAQVLEIDADGGTREVGPGWNVSADSVGVAESESAARYTAIVRAAAEKYELSPLLLDAIARAESGYHATAASPAGAIGIMQLMPATARELGVDPWDPVQNIFGGAAFLRQQLDRFNGNLELALAAYNAGSECVIRFGVVPPYAQTRRYIEQNLERLAAASPPALPSTPLPSTWGEARSMKAMLQHSARTGALALSQLPLRAWAQTAALDPAGSGPIVAALSWVQGTLLGNVATTVAVIAVAMVGFMMLTGRINWRIGATVILGCFILFGAATIVGGIRAAAG